MATCKDGIALIDVCGGFCSVSSKVDPVSSWARGVRGPTSAAILSALRLGWSFTGPTKLHKRCGAIRDRTLIPPSVIKKEALEAFFASSAVKAVPRALDLRTSKGNRADGLMILPLSRIYKSKGLSNLQRGRLLGRHVCWQKPDTRYLTSVPCAVFPGTPSPTACADARPRGSIGASSPPPAGSRK